MNVELDRGDLINLLKGSTPSIDQINYADVRQCGQYVGGMVERWEWGEIPDHFSNQHIWEMYQVIKNGWT